MPLDGFVFVAADSTPPQFVNGQLHGQSFLLSDLAFGWL